MTAIMIIVATLFGGLLDRPLAAPRDLLQPGHHDVEAFCDDIGCDDTCASDDYQSDNSATGDRDD